MSNNYTFEYDLNNNNHLTVYSGRPDDTRLPVEERCYDLLDSLGISYARVDHPQADTIEDCETIGQALGFPVCKNLFLTNRQQTDFYLLLMEGHKPFKTKHLSKQLGVSRLSFAGSDAMESLLGVAPGSVSVLGLMNDTQHRLRLVMDRGVYEGEYICCHPCKNTSTLKIKTTDILSAVLPHIGHDITVVDLPIDDE